MSRIYHDPYRMPELDDEVEFDYEGSRLRGEIVRTSSNPTYYHVLVNGERYEVDSVVDNMVVL